MRNIVSKSPGLLVFLCLFAMLCVKAQNQGQMLTQVEKDLASSDINKKIAAINLLEKIFFQSESRKHCEKILLLLVNCVRVGEKQVSLQVLTPGLF